ncbi:clumping factor B precursor [Lysobacter enzymogenes]|uniref:Clumping factor B n=1 Tax=Lysobacter enzymogenes TaxID=69 RepID=A0A0S2DJQ1_LYSEN|nr:hypothetical protein [Lysobacter enzymogenes]ALN58756.1 clumping factor B precursor [Lysobacter enzymogenes]
MSDKNTVPGSSDPRPGHSPGYPEPQPKDREDAHRPKRPKPDPDEGGLDREPETGPDPD